jgi:DNA-binding MarR family transcriptional regulator
MADKTSAAVEYRSQDRLSDGTLETSRLLVEFLHAAYATRNLNAGEANDAGPADSAAAGGDSQPPHGTATPGLSSHAVRAAIHVYRYQERTVGQLSSGLGISYGWASRVVEELETAGYLTRERDPEDRRVVRVRLNPDKIEEVQRAYQWRGEAVQEALEPLDESEREAVRVFLRRVIDLLRGSLPEQS